MRTPATAWTIAEMRSSMPAGALSIRASSVSRPSLTLTHTTTAETPSAATESPPFQPALTPIKPKITTDELQISVWKCRASASSAWLWYFVAARESTRDREKSVTIEIPITAKDQALTSTTAL